VAAGALFLDEHDRIMLVRPTYKDYWDIPGGYVEAGETPHEACIRETKEELGLEIIPLRVLVVDWAPHPSEGDKLLFVFDSGVLSKEIQTSIRLQPDELAEFRFVTQVEAEGLLIPRLARRIAAAITSSTSGGCSYLEHGQAFELPR
jgi:8-oxo-dGTP diphosphatase